MAIAPISSQPMPMSGMGLNAPGLGILSKLNSIQIKEERTTKDCCCGDMIPFGPWGWCCGPPKKIFTLAHPDSVGSQLISLEEDSGCCRRRCCTRMRDFTTKAFDYSTKQEIFRVVRDFQCGPCCCNTCCPQGFYGWYGQLCTDGFRLKVESNTGATLGYVEQQTSCCSLEFHILNSSRLPVYKFNTTLVDGCCTNPCWVFPCNIPSCFRWCGGCQDVVAKLTNVHGAEVGAIRFQYPGCSDAFFCLKHQFRIDFPGDADSELKATLIGAALLLENFFGPYNPIYCWN